MPASDTNPTVEGNLNLGTRQTLVTDNEVIQGVMPPMHVLLVS